MTPCLVLTRESGADEIPPTVEVIDSGAFASQRELTSVTIPDSVVSIRGNAFSFCTGLVSIEILRPVVSIGICVFNGRSGLWAAYAPKGLEFPWNSIPKMAKKNWY